MPTLQAEQILDMLQATQSKLDRGKFTDLSTELVKYVAAPEILNKEKTTESSGAQLEWRVLTKDNGSAKNTGLYSVDVLNQVDGLATASIPWRHSEASYTIDLREVPMNSGTERVVDLVAERQHMAKVSLVKLMEKNFWGKPLSSSDKETPYGLTYWIVKNSSEGYTGTNPSGFSDVAGLDSSSATYAGWRNWSAQYTAISPSDFVAKVRKAMTYTDFTPPVKDYQEVAKGHRKALYTNYSVIATLEEMLRGNNDNLGSDLAKYDGETTIRRTPVEHAPYLDADTSNPIYGIDWGTFTTVALQGRWMLESKLEKVALSHNQVASYIDCTYNWKCVDRRSNFVIYK